MTDTPAQTTQPQPTPPVGGEASAQLTESTVTLAPLKRLGEDLLQAGMSEESVGYILGRIASRIAMQVMSDAAQVVEADTISKMETVESEEERLQMLDTAFQAKKGMSLFQYRDHLAEQMIAEYDSLA